MYDSPLVNIITAVLVDNAWKIAEPDKAPLLLQKRRDDKRRCDKLSDLMRQIDQTSCYSNGMISWDDMQALHANHEIRDCLDLAGIDISDVDSFFFTVGAKKNIAVIGAGVAGLQVANLLTQSGMKVTVFEKANNVGGVWRENYADFGLQVPKELYEFPGFHGPRIRVGVVPTWTTGPRVHRSLRQPLRPDEACEA